MESGSNIYCQYLQILKEELVPAMGCTEPIAIALAAAKMCEVLGESPKRLNIQVSRNIIKNAKSVVVPNTGGLSGIAAAAAAGVVAGKSELMLEVISKITEDEKAELKTYLDHTPIEVEAFKGDTIFYIEITGFGTASNSANVVIRDFHTNFVHIEKNGTVLFENEAQSGGEQQTDRSVLNVEEIIEFADMVDLEDIKEVIGRQIRYNSAIAEEGLRRDYGANIGKVILDTYGDDVKIRAKAMAAAGSDARMHGCELPVIIISGSGNQGITASVPVIEFAKEMKVSEDTLYRALVVSDLVTIHQKTGIGRLSAYCGAVVAGCGSGAGITYLYGGRYKEIAHTIVNTLAVSSGIVCDGAKSSCAAKIALSVEAGIMGFSMYRHGQQFRDGEGIVKKGVESTIVNIGKLAKEGMKQTDEEIISLMIQS